MKKVLICVGLAFLALVVWFIDYTFLNIHLVAQGTSPECAYMDEEYRHFAALKYRIKQYKDDRYYRREVKRTGNRRVRMPDGSIRFGG